MTQTDLTMVFDPAAIWPNAEDCPDWPLANDALNRRMNPPRSLVEAQGSLSHLGRAMNDGKPVTAPTDAQRAELRARYFKARPSPTATHRVWDALGLTDIRAASPGVNSTAEQIVLACHLRGYIRKLSERERLARERRAAARLAGLRDKVGRAPDQLARFAAELAEAEKGEKRHHQRLADEHAATRAAELRRAIDAITSEAAQAEATLAAA